ncbi:MAG: dienelactone hydrolase family protein [Verrucomicrobiae bacterium]
MFLRELFFPFVFLAATAVARADVASFPVAGVGGSEKVEFFYRKTAGIPTGVLLLVPGYNGSGSAMLDERWSRFADEHGLVLLAPTFQTTPEQLKKEKGYYYPEQGSGGQVEAALAEVRRKTGVKTDQVLIFGFSAGAHFAHRFALWKPERVRAFVAYSAAWWSEPKASLRPVPALIMCGETDERYEATRAFFEKALALHLPWVWRSYKNTGHQLTPAIRLMAEVFLAHYAGETSSRETTQSDSDGDVFYGDIQTYRVVPDKDSIPEEVRVELPSQTVAETWMKEN